MARLFVAAGTAGPSGLELSDAAVVGRALSCHVRADDGALSKTHFVIRRDDDRFVLENRSDHSTRVNDEIVSGTRLLDHQDVIRAGRQVLVFVEDVPVARAEDPAGHGATEPAGPEEDTRPLDSGVEPDAASVADAWLPDSPIRPTEAILERLARKSTEVLILGESGTGKSWLAREIHGRGARKDLPFVTFLCTTVQPTLFEAEIFGYAKGAFTGAATDKAGLIEQAGDGTLFLDEIGDLPLDVQAKLLRFLTAERAFRRLSDKQDRVSKARLIMATNRDLAGLVRSGGFREDLLNRIWASRVVLSPLRQRPEDVRPAAITMARRCGSDAGLADVQLSEAAVGLLRLQPWIPGNFHQMRGVIAQAVDRLEAGCLIVDTRHLAGLLEHESPAVFDASLSADRTTGGATGTGESIEEATSRLERQRIMDALARAGNSMTRAAGLLGFSQDASGATKLRRWMKRLGMEPVSKKSKAMGGARARGSRIAQPSDGQAGH